MVIDLETRELLTDEFKKLIPMMTWIKKDRILGTRKETFYRGSFESEEIIVSATIRPTMRMQLSESFKKRDKDGKVIPPDRKVRSNEIVDYGTTIQLLVDEDFVKEIDKLANAKEYKTPQKLSWS